MHETISKQRCLVHVVVLAMLAMVHGLEDAASGSAQHLEKNEVATPRHVQLHHFEGEHRPSVMRREVKSQAGADLETKGHLSSNMKSTSEDHRVKGTMHMSVDNGSKFLSQSHVEDCIVEGIADAANVNQQAVKILEMSMPSAMLEQATLSAGGEVRGGHGKHAVQEQVQFDFEIQLPAEQADSLQSHLTATDHTILASKIGDALKHHGATDMNLMIHSVALQERAQKSTSMTAAFTELEERPAMFGLVGEMELTLNPGISGFAGNTDTQDGICAGVAYASGRAVTDCKVTRYLQSVDTDARFQFNLTVNDNEYEKMVYKLENADMATVGNKIKEALGASFTGALTITKLVATHQARAVVYVGVLGALELNVGGDAENLMGVISNAAARAAAKKAVADICQVQLTEVQMSYAEGDDNSFLELEEASSVRPAHKRSDSIMNCSFYIHAKEAWQVKERIDGADKAAMKTAIDAAFTAATITSTVTIDKFYAEKITAAQAAARPPPSDPWSTSTGASSGTTVAEIGGWLNFTSDHAEQFLSDSEGQMAIKETLAHIGHIAVEEFRIEVHRVPDLAVFHGTNLYSTENATAAPQIDAVAIKWSADMLELFIKIVEKRIQKVSHTELATKLADETGKMPNLVQPTAITITSLTCHTEPVHGSHPSDHSGWDDAAGE